MSPFSRPVLLPSLLLCSPVLLDAYAGAVPWSDALNRFLLVLAVCWLAVSVVHALAFSPSKPTPARSVDPAAESAGGGPDGQAAHAPGGDWNAAAADGPDGR